MLIFLFFFASIYSNYFENFKNCKIDPYLYYKKDSVIKFAAQYGPFISQKRINDKSVLYSSFYYDENTEIIYTFEKNKLHVKSKNIYLIELPNKVGQTIIQTNIRNSYKLIPKRVKLLNINKIGTKIYYEFLFESTYDSCLTYYLKGFGFFLTLQKSNGGIFVEKLNHNKVSDSLITYILENSKGKINLTADKIYPQIDTTEVRDFDINEFLKNMDSLVEINNKMNKKKKK